MWDFSLAKTFSVLSATFPFLLLRLAVFFGIPLAYVLVTGAGAGLGFGFGWFAAEPEAYAFWGGLAGFGLLSGALYLAREYLLYLVKAGHIAVMVEAFDGKPLPAGQGQIAYATGVVKARFVESSVLFAVDQLIKGILAAITGALSTVASFLPVPGLQNLVQIFNAILKLSLTYVDEVILAHMIRTRSTEPWGAARTALVLDAQNYWAFAKNAIWLAIFMWVLTAALFIAMVGPMLALFAAMPGDLSAIGFVVAFVFALSVKAAVLEPFAIACLMQAFFRITHGQVPDPSWDERLAGMTSRFQDLRQKAGGPLGAGQAAPAA